MNTVIRAFIIFGAVASLSLAASEAGKAPHWSYHGASGPAHWGELEADFAACKAGREQSPVDLATGASGALAPLEFHYQAQALDVLNNGHTIQVDGAHGGTVTAGGGQYALAQFHFHGPSEHTVGGKHFPLEMHLVHKDAAGKLAVVGVLIKEGKANPTLADILAHLPAKVGEARSEPKIAIDAAALLPASRGYSHYRGSLTTPPCSEGVQWYVLAEPIEASKDQIAALTKAMGENDRPVQPLNGRKIEGAAGGR